MTNDFWKNVFRYPSFFISSMVGLLLIILRPFKNLFKNNKFKPLVIIGLLTFIFLLYLIIINMVIL